MAQKYIHSLILFISKCLYIFLGHSVWIYAWCADLTQGVMGNFVVLFSLLLLSLLCYFCCCFTFVVLLLLLFYFWCYFNFFAEFLLVCYFCCCYFCCVTFVATLVLCYFCCVTFVVTLVLCYVCCYVCCRVTFVDFELNSDFVPELWALSALWYLSVHKFSFYSRIQMVAGETKFPHLILLWLYE